MGSGDDLSCLLSVQKNSTAMAQVNSRRLAAKTSHSHDQDPCNNWIHAVSERKQIRRFTYHLFTHRTPSPCLIYIQVGLNHVCLHFGQNSGLHIWLWYVPVWFDIWINNPRSLSVKVEWGLPCMACAVKELESVCPEEWNLQVGKKN